MILNKLAMDGWMDGRGVLRGFGGVSHAMEMLWC